MNGCSRQERLQGPHGRSSRVVGSMSYRIGLDIVQYVNIVGWYLISEEQMVEEMKDDYR